MEFRSDRFVLRSLSLASRLAVAPFFMCVGIGCFEALLQLHFQLAQEAVSGIVED